VIGPAEVDSYKSRSAALAAAEKSMTLLKNEGQLLPFPMGKSTKFAFVGPHANATQNMFVTACLKRHVFDGICLTMTLSPCSLHLF
jgi:beta-glucosidase-like glycosyl hydrolase